MQEYLAVAGEWLMVRAGLIFGAMAIVEVPAQASEPESRISLTLAPVAGSIDTAAIASVNIRLRIDGLDIDRGAPLLRLPLVVSNVDTVATSLADIDARDARGKLRLSWRDVDLPESGMRDAVGGGPTREWIADRAVHGALTVRYSISAQATLPPRGPAPPFSLSADGGGVSGAGHMFLLLPPGDTRYRTTFDWDLSHAPAKSRGVSSLGEGRRTAQELLSPAELRMTFFMAGRIGTWPATVPENGFFGAWQGSPCFDPEGLLAWTGDLYGRYAEFFGQTRSPPYAVFLRHNPINAGGGVGLHQAFVTTFGNESCTDLGKIRLTLAHEMFHTFQPFISTPGGLESSWFGEGLATYYQSRLPFRFGLLTPEEYIADVNWTAARYYSSVMARVPNSEVPKRFWADTRIRTLPYDRGMLYFANIDYTMRKTSGGRLSLDTLVMAMRAREHSGKATSNSDWEELLDQYLGLKAVEGFRAFLDGEMPILESDAFGPCFRRIVKPMRRYELGFATDVLAEPKRIVRGLVTGSAADKAGLRNGDEIVDPVPQDAIQGEQEKMLSLRVLRDGEIFSLTYLPRGEVVDVWQWERISPSGGRSCD